MSIKKSFALEVPVAKNKPEQITDLNRKSIWLEVTGARYLLEDHPEYYFHLKSQTPATETKAMKQIEKDLNRTFPGDRSFSRLQLKEILIAYSLRNPNVGYCQGLNFIVALLLSFGFSEDESFWIFTQIIEKYLPFEYFTSMAGVLLDQKVFDYLFRLKLPKLCKHIERLGVESCLFTVQWFICLYAFTFPKDTVKQLWDIIFVHGYNSMFQIGLCTMSIISKDIMSKSEFVQILDGVDQGCKTLTDFTHFSMAFNIRTFRIKTVLINKLKVLLEDEIKDDFKERFPEMPEPDKLLRSLSCKCISDEECKQKVFITSGFFTFCASEVNVTEDFLDTAHYPKILNANYLRDNETIYMVGRKNHCCGFENEVDFSDDDDEDDDINFLRKNTAASVKKSFAQISNHLNPHDLD